MMKRERTFHRKEFIMRIYGFICSACGHELHDDKEYCPNCGTPYEGIPKLIGQEHYRARIHLINTFIQKQGGSHTDEVALLDSVSETLFTLMFSGYHLNEKTISEFFRNHETVIS
jgi:hypothetical protein